MEEINDIDIRIQCLIISRDSMAINTHTKKVIARAQEYYNFVEKGYEKQHKYPEAKAVKGFKNKDE